MSSIEQRRRSAASYRIISRLEKEYKCFYIFHICKKSGTHHYVNSTTMSNKTKKL